MTPIIEIKNLHKSFGKFQALKGVDLTVNQGEIFGFLGCNGAGKSTTIRCLLTLIKKDSGEILYKGRRVEECREEFLRKVGCLVEKPDFYKSLSAYTNMRLSAMMYGAPVTRADIYEKLKLVGLEGVENVRVKNYSQGMKQRLGIAVALIHDPEIIILDEPSNGLDPRGMIELRNLILQLKNDLKKTIIISSHILSEIERIVDRLVIIHKGINIVQGSARELLESGDLLVTIETREPKWLSGKIKNSRFKDQWISSDGNTIVMKTDMNELPDLHREIILMGEPVDNFHSVKKLEDLFLKLTES